MLEGNMCLIRIIINLLLWNPLPAPTLLTLTYQQWLKELIRFKGLRSKNNNNTLRNLPLRQLMTLVINLGVLRILNHLRVEVRGKNHRVFTLITLPRVPKVTQIVTWATKILFLCSNLWLRIKINRLCRYCYY